MSVELVGNHRTGKAAPVRLSRWEGKKACGRQITSLAAEVVDTRPCRAFQLQGAAKLVKINVAWVPEPVDLPCVVMLDRVRNPILKPSDLVRLRFLSGSQLTPGSYVA